MLPSQQPSQSQLISSSDKVLSCLCGHLLIPFDWLCQCTYSKANHCTLLYDHQIRYTSDDQIDQNHINNQKLMVNMNISESPKKKIILHTLHCKKCNEKVATVIKTNIEFTVDEKVKQFSDGFVCFRPEATFIKGIEQQKVTKKKWPERNLPFLMKYESFSDYIPQSLLSPPQPPQLSEGDVNELIETTILPNLNDKNLVEYYPPLLHSIPRDYQIEMYFQSLFNNSLICLPTGLGKTLISVLLMKKMSQLNPNKLIAFIVNKIPLAFQQSEYYSRETGDESLVLCSQTRTAESIQRLIDRQVQVCFFTDGLLLNLFENQMLKPEDFSMVVFDEIHHGLSSNSRYNLLGNAFLNSKTEIKITGLTASPIDYEQLVKSFKINSISYPSLQRLNMEEISNSATTEIIKTSLKEEQELMLKLLRKEIVLLNEKLNEFKINNIWNFNSFISIVGYLRLYIPKSYQEFAQKMLKFISLMEITTILGTKQAMEHLNSSIELSYSITKFKNIVLSDSERFSALESILKETDNNSRILVFVKTKEMTFKLTRLLERKFNQFYPQGIVGQYGVGGMDYETEQRELIEAFKNHNCKLLISTSVLEEGIDISDCNVVVLFDGNLSLRRIIQSRGRARQKDSTFHLIIEKDEQEYYENIEKQEENMIQLISNKSDEISKNIKTILEDYFEYRKTLVPIHYKLLSFTIHHSESITSDDIRKTMQTFKKKFRMIEWDKQCEYIEMTIDETIFENVRREVFNKLLDNHSALFIEPKDHLYSFDQLGQYHVKPGALTLSNENGFEFIKNEHVQLSELDEDVEYHNELLRASPGKYLLIDERTQKYIFNIRNSQQLNMYSVIGNIEEEKIPNHFHDFKIYFIKLKESMSSDLILNNDDNGIISYYMSYIQDRHPMINITQNIIESLIEKLKSLMKDDSFSSSAFEMSLFIIEMSNFIKKCTFTTELKVLQFIDNFKVYQPSTLIEKNKLIKSVSYNKRMIHELPQLVDDKRFFRKFHPDHFIKVKISGEIFPSSITCCGKVYLPLGGSLSMLRSNYVFFFDSTIYKTIDELMSIFGIYDSNLNPFKLISRHALNFTTTIETCTISKWKHVKDDTAQDDSIVTDGIGKISSSIAQQISDQLGLISIPTAIQVRFLGYKGVLTVLPDEDVKIVNENNESVLVDVIVRESMCKFNGNVEFNKIELVSHTNRRRPAFLNKQIILLLLSLGISNETFLNIFLEYFKDLSKKITSPQYLLQILKDNCIDTLPAIQSLEEMPNDQFLLYLAKYLIYHSIKKVQTKAMIPIEKAMIAMGIVDEYKELKENEVMVLLGDGEYLPDGTKVFICRNPCMHPSDIQLFTCRTSQILIQKYRRDDAAIIFPTQRKTSIKLCDFDGDRVFVCWDTRLIPNHQVVKSADDDDENDPIEIVNEHSEALSKILENGKLLGKISDGWIAVTDSEDANSDKSIELANLFVKAVDFPKNGKSIILPIWFDDIVYPDFMERNTSIKSNSILGRIYQKCIKIKSDIPFDDYQEVSSITIENEKVKEWNRRFWQIIEYLKQVHSCTIFDLIVGNDIERREFTHFIEQFRQILRDDDDDCKLAIQNLPISNLFSLTIPSRRIKTFNKLDITMNLSKSLTLYYLEHLNLEKLEMMEHRLEQLKNNQKDYNIHMFGSLPILLSNSNSSDCDIYINFKAEKGDKKAPPICSTLSKREFKCSDEGKWHESIPMYRITLNELPFIESIDFTNSSRGLRKKHHLRLYLKQQPTLIIILKVLIDILKKICPLIIKTYQWLWKIIDYCLFKKFIIQENAPSEQESFDNECEKDSQFMKQILSKCNLNADLRNEIELIVNFLNDLQFNEIMNFIDNLNGEITTIHLTLEQVINFRDLIDSCLLNLYLLHDFNKLNIEEFEDSQVYIPNLLRKVIGNEMLETVLKFELEKSCHCKVTKIINMNGNYIINATGEYGIGLKLKRKLAIWNANCKYFRANNHRLFLEGSTLTIFEGDSMKSPIKFDKYEGKRNPKHNLEPITVYQPKLKNYNEMYQDNLQLYDFHLNLSNQIDKMEAIDLNPNHFSYSIKFGIYYLINIEKSIFSDSIPLDSKHYNMLMKKNHFHSIEDVKKNKEKKSNIDTTTIDYEVEWPLIEYSKISGSKKSLEGSKSSTSTKKNNQLFMEEEEIKKKVEEKKAPSDSFLTIVNEECIFSILKELEYCEKQEYTEYHVCEIENKKNSIEYKIKLDENLKLKSDGILSRKTRVIATTFIGKSNDMRFYINHSKFLDEDHEIVKRLQYLNKNEWIIRIDSPQQLTYHERLLLVNVVRKVEKKIYIYLYGNNQFEITILKVSLFTKRQMSTDQVLDLTSEHYEVKIALPKTGELHSSISCMALLSCGIHFWKIIQNHQ